MMWSDYQKFMEVAPKECQYPYVYQCPFTEQEALIEASRLRRSDTTGFTKWEHENVGKQYDRGIFLDIFPMFYIPDSEEERRAQKEIVLYYWRVIRGYEALQYKKRTGSLNPSYNSYIPVFQEYYKKMGSQSIDIFNLKKQYLDACAWENVRSKEVGYTSKKCHLKSLMWETKWFESFVELPFEYTKIWCPAEYEKVLEHLYGDWRTPIRGKSEHEMFAIDPETPWKEYVLSHDLYPCYNTASHT